jgi:protein-disulfide isomerase
VCTSIKQVLILATVAVVAVVLALSLFFAGFFVRGWVDQRQLLVLDLPVRESPPAEVAASPTGMPTADTAPVAQASHVDVDDDPARGPENALVTIIEFSDYQCPFCKRYVDQTLPLILDTYGDRVRYVFRDFPIARSHPQATRAAEATQCAYEQGRFWEYHDLLFQNQGRLDEASLREHAGSLGLEQSTFDQCLESGKYSQEVQDDFTDGQAYGVTGAPTFFINGRKLVGAKPFPTFQEVIEEELGKAAAQ